MIICKHGVDADISICPSCALREYQLGQNAPDRQVAREYVEKQYGAPNRNEMVLADFVSYCQQHPTERFWQALRNWSGYPFILTAEMEFKNGYGPLTVRKWEDTFHWEGKKSPKNIKNEG